MAGDVLTRRYLVTGQVQGVGYRFFVLNTAVRLGLRGFVRNLRDGRVEAVACGSAERLAAFCAELKRGPRFAAVESVCETEAARLPASVTEYTIEPGYD